MAPPRKRRRLSISSDLPLFEPVLASGGINSPHHDEDLCGARTVPRRMEEVHMHLQRRAVSFEVDQPAELEKRQTAYEISTINVNGSSVLTTITVGLDAGAATSMRPAETTAAATTNSKATPTPTPTDNVRTGKTVSVVTASTNSAKSSRSSPRSTGTSNTSLPSTFKATLTNGNVRTITRSSSAYLTTFPDGEVSTICNVNDQCRLAATSGQSSTASSGGSGSSSAAEVGGMASSQQHNNGDGGSTPLASIAGGVVGGLAGLALILVGALLFLRWYKRRKEQGHELLGHGTPEPEIQSSPTQPGMSERTALAPAIFSYQNKSVEASGSGASGFQKVSGRKLPPAYADHPAHRNLDRPNSDIPPTAPAQDINNTSFYRDSYGFYSGDGTHNDEPQESPEPTPGSDQKSGEMTLSPGPQRRPTVVNDPGPFVVTPSSGSPDTQITHARSPSGPGIGLSPFLERSATPTTMRSETPSSIPDNRSSRFTEDFQ